MDNRLSLNLISKYDLFIWDFDLTIIKIHSFANHTKEDEIQSLSWKKLMCHFYDPIFFRDLVYFLRGNKKKVAIISFGHYNVIKAYLDRLFDDTNIFNKHNIITPDQNCNRRSNTDKNQYIINIARELNIKYNRIMFFDDTVGNINSAKELGVEAIQIEKEGFNHKVWNDLAIQSDSSSEQFENIETKGKKEKREKREKGEDEEDEEEENKNEIKEGFSSPQNDNLENNNLENEKNKSNSNSLFSSKIIIKDEYIVWVYIIAVIFIIVYFYLRR
jgi:hypothetical protein